MSDDVQVGFEYESSAKTVGMVKQPGSPRIMRK